MAKALIFEKLISLGSNWVTAVARSSGMILILVLAID